MGQFHSLKEIRELTKDLVVLYVEDEDDIRSRVTDIFSLFFKKVYTAEDGIIGLNELQKHPVDLLITDIQMPRLNGLKLVEQSREIYPDLPVMITTAFSDQDYFIQSIDLKVDKYLLKPINQDSVTDAVYSIARMIDDRKKAKELEIRKMQEKINSMSEHLVSLITDSYQSPCIVYSNNEVKYVNDTFCSLFDDEEVELFLSNNIKLNMLFDEREGFLSSLEEFNDEALEKNVVSISKRQGRKIYRVIKKEIDNGKESNLIYFFNDITLEEYQKIKIKSYSEILAELVFNERYRQQKSRVASKASGNTSTVINDQSIEQKSSSTEPKEKLVINDVENELLRRSHIHKTDAKTYILELDNEILQELQELDELDKDFGDSIMIFQEDSNIDGMRQMGTQLERYAHEISLLFEFDDLAYAIRSLSKLLLNVNESQLDEKSMRKIAIILDGIKSDLAAWRQVIFIEQSALDIHYLDSSLFSACLQIELALSDEIYEIESEEDDLILF